MTVQTAPALTLVGFSWLRNFHVLLLEAVPKPAKHQVWRVAADSLPDGECQGTQGPSSSAAVHPEAEVKSRSKAAGNREEVILGGRNQEEGTEGLSTGLGDRRVAWVKIYFS